MCLQFGKWHSLAVKSYLHCFWFYVHRSYDFCWPSWFSSVLFFPLQQFPSFPKTSQNKKHTIKTPSKFPIPPKIPKQQKQPQKKSTSAIFVAQLVQNRMNFLDDASQFWPRVAQTLEGVEGDSAWIAGKTMGTSSIDGGFTYGFNRNIIYRWRFYLWF